MLTSLGLTTESDVASVRNTVKSRHSSSVLAVMPCNVDIATQEILKLSEAVDPNGVRTMGALTKPDLASEKATQGRLASRFQAVTQSVLNGYYSSDSIFDTVPSLKLVTAKMGLNETFSEIFLKRGHKRQSSAVDEEAAVFSNISDETPRLELTECPDLRDIVSSDDYSCPKPLEGFIEEHIKDIFKSSRGPEIGTIR
ncbi:hypothetical protein NPX13_g1995 [Xylaria arbuscula]|uniref:Dynamin N-terminal domain-containing protein n=1 Tax=Xylaria arbuscula TaxID=114810 RepID=A0A9W8NK09_9PEZI|nr:hypothetical protein NPX13_g1995 [Xylaria arbuscula]